MLTSKTDTNFPQQPRPWSSLSDDEDLEDELGLVLAAVDDDRPLSGISSHYNRATSIATTATLVHVHKREPVTMMMPAVKDRTVHRNHVIFHDKPNSYSTVIKVKYGCHYCSGQELSLACRAVQSQTCTWDKVLNYLYDCMGRRIDSYCDVANNGILGRECIESELSFLNGSFLNNYDVINRKL